jgi:hypothetical protein
MKKILPRFYLVFLFFLSSSPFFLGCATPAANKVSEAGGGREVIPLKAANLEMVMEQQEGLEVNWDDAKEVRDLYRGGVQQKAKGEKSYQGNAYSEAMQSYQSSNDFLSKLLTYLNEDTVDFNLFEGTSILFFPNLLMADNYYKMGLIYRQMGKENSAQRSWKRALSSIRKSLLSERTEWGLGLQKDILSLLPIR